MKIKKYKFQIDEENKRVQNEENEKEKDVEEAKLYKHNRVYFYDRRIKKMQNNRK